MTLSTRVAILRQANLLLVLGTEQDVTATEVTTQGKVVRLGPGALRATEALLQSRGVPVNDLEKLVVIDSDADPEHSADINAAHEYQGDTDDQLSAILAALSSSARTAILAEAAAAAWQQQLADAADIERRLTRAESAEVGRINVVGSPSLLELLAERRRALSVDGAPSLARNEHSAETDIQTSMALLITELREKVRFGAVGLADSTEDDVVGALAAAVGEKNWSTSVRLLHVAEEISAIELLLGARSNVQENNEDTQEAYAVRILALVAEHRRETETLIVAINAALARVPEPTNPMRRLTQRGAVKNGQQLIDAVAPFTLVTAKDVVAPDLPRSSPDEVSNLIRELDETVADMPAGKELALSETGWGERGQTSSLPIEEAAAALGELFEAQLANAQHQIEELRQRHPGENAEVLVAQLKRRAITELSRDRTDGEDGGTPLLDTVATLTMAIAVLRGIELRSRLDYQQLGTKILSQSGLISKIRVRARQATPIVVSGFERYVRDIQPLVIETIFHSFSAAKPSKPGAARDAYKTLRSQVWRARHNRNVGAGAARTASHALLRALDSGSARLLVRNVDRALKL